MEKGATKKTPKKNKPSSDKDTLSKSLEDDDGSVLRGWLILGKNIADSIQKKCEVEYIH